MTTADRLIKHGISVYHPVHGGPFKGRVKHVYLLAGTYRVAVPELGISFGFARHVDQRTRTLVLESA